MEHPALEFMQNMFSHPKIEFEIVKQGNVWASLIAGIHIEPHEYETFEIILKHPGYQLLDRKDWTEDLKEIFNKYLESINFPTEDFNE